MERETHKCKHIWGPRATSHGLGPRCSQDVYRVHWFRTEVQEDVPANIITKLKANGMRGDIFQAAATAHPKALWSEWWRKELGKAETEKHAQRPRGVNLQGIQLQAAEIWVTRLRRWKAGEEGREKASSILDIGLGRFHSKSKRLRPRKALRWFQQNQATRLHQDTQDDDVACEFPAR